MLRRRIAGTAVVAFAAALGTSACVPVAPGPIGVSVDAAVVTGSFPHELFGINGLPGDVVGEPALQPSMVRLDARLDLIYGCDTSTLAPDPLTALEADIDAAQALGAEVLLILDYLPECLAAPGGLGVFGPTRRPPEDPGRWGDAVAVLMEVLSAGRVAAGKAPVLYYETWNEPDGFFFDGTVAEFVHGVFEPELEARDRVRAETGMDVRLGGCGCTVANFYWIDRLAAAASEHGDRLDFISWHHYGNFPLLGPDGIEPGVGFPQSLVWLYPLISGVNPFTSPARYATDAARIAREHPGTPLIVSEWNLSAGGFDRRMDTHVGAAFQLATMIAMARAGVSRALFFRARETHHVDYFGNPLPELHGGWGLVARTGEPKPAWYAQSLFASMPARQVAVGQVDPARTAIWSIAARGPSKVSVLLAGFTPSGTQPARTVELEVDNLPSGCHDVALARIDAEHQAPVPVTDRECTDSSGHLELDLRLDARAILSVDISISGASQVD